MTSQEFVIWLKGFTEGVHEFNVSPKQWDLLKERLSEVEDNKFVETPGMFQVHPEPPYPGVRFPNTAPIKPLPYYPNPLHDPFRVTCGTDTGSYLNIAGPNTNVLCKIVNGSTGSGSTGTVNTTGYPKDSSITYTTGKTLLNGSEFTKQLLKDNYNYTLKKKDGKSK